MANTVRKRSVMARSSGVGSIAGLLPLLVGSVLVAAAATAAAPSVRDWFFQSPVSPLGPGHVASPSVPQETVTGPALVSVPAPANFVPWIIGILAVGALVVVTLFWRRGKEEGGEDA